MVENIRNKMKGSGVAVHVVAFSEAKNMSNFGPPVPPAAGGTAEFPIQVAEFAGLSFAKHPLELPMNGTLFEAVFDSGSDFSRRYHFRLGGNPWDAVRCMVGTNA